MFKGAAADPLRLPAQPFRRAHDPQRGGPQREEGKRRQRRGDDHHLNAGALYPFPDLGHGTVGDDVAKLGHFGGRFIDLGQIGLSAEVKGGRIGAAADQPGQLPGQRQDRFPHLLVPRIDDLQARPQNDEAGVSVGIRHERTDPAQEIRSLALPAGVA